MTALENAPIAEPLDEEILSKGIDALRKGLVDAEGYVVREWPADIDYTVWYDEVLDLFNTFNTLPYDQIRDVRFVVIGAQSGDIAVSNSVRLAALDLSSSETA